MEPSAIVSQTAASAETATEMALSSPRKQRAAKEDARKAAAAQKELRQQAMLPADDEDKNATPTPPWDAVSSTTV